jgi:hypothetical protein
MSPYGTHLRILTKYLLQCPENSTIVETGCGLFSSLLITEFALVKKLKHIIYYSDKKWQNDIAQRVHKEVSSFVYVNDWSTWTPDSKAFLYLHDSEESTPNRYKRIPKILPQCYYLIIHDSDMYRKLGCNIDHYNIIEEDSSLTPQTAVLLSNYDL